MNLSGKEEASMVSWSLMPHTSNEKWWQNYYDCKAKGDFRTWDMILKDFYKTEKEINKW